MKSATPSDRVTPDLASRDENRPETVDKKQLCNALGWSRPTLDRRLRADRNFPVLRCGKQGETWQFDLRAVVAYVVASGRANSRHSSVHDKGAGPSTEAGHGIAWELAHAQALHRVIAELVADLGVTLGRLAIALGHSRSRR